VLGQERERLVHLRRGAARSARYEIRVEAILIPVRRFDPDGPRQEDTMHPVMLRQLAADHIVQLIADGGELARAHPDLGPEGGRR
jgi:hypothetical protein